MVDLRGGLVDGAIDLNLLERMTIRLAHRGPDGISFWSAGPVGLAFTAMYTTPESEGETQPHPDSQGMCRLVFDGRLDDRVALRKELVSRGQRVREDSDAELALCSYLAWGEDCARHLLGDFALVVWDGRRRQLYCARDIMGLRPFYYSLTGSKFLFASEPRALLESADVSREPNEELVAEHLSCDFRSNEETLFRAIRRLAPAHQMVVTATDLRITRYWSPDPARSIRYSADREYADHFLDLFRTAVRERMRVNGRLGSFLSGGMDSSSIVNVTLELLRQQGQAAEEFNTFSMIFPGDLCDESRYIAEMQSLWGHTSNTLVPSEAAPEKFSLQALRNLDFPGYPNGDLIFDPLRALARSMNIRVLLSGVGGDEWFTGSPFHYADYLKDGEWGKLARQLVVDRRDYPKDRREAPVLMPRHLVLQLGVLPLLPDHARGWIRWVLRRKLRRPPFMSEELWQRMAAARAARLRTAAPQLADFPTHSQRDIARILTHAWSQHAIEMLERSTAQDGMEFRYPFEDRRIIEFGLALPEDQRWRGLWTKFVLREAMKGRLPESIRLRRTKSDFSHLVVESLLGLSQQGLFSDMLSADLGWVRPDAAARAAQRLAEQLSSGTGEYTKDFWPLWMAAGIEMWARAALPEGRRRIS